MNDSSAEFTLREFSSAPGGFKRLHCEADSFDDDNEESKQLFGSEAQPSKRARQDQVTD